MRPEVRDRLLAAADEAVQQLGLGTFDEAIDMACRIGEAVLPMLERMRTRERLRSELDQMELPTEDEEFAIAAIRMLPTFLGIELRSQLPKALNDLPGLKKGRKRILDTKGEADLCRFIAGLYGTGVELRDAKRRAAIRFNVGIRTIERIWANRKTVSETVSQPEFSEVVEWIKRLK